MDSRSQKEWIRTMKRGETVYVIHHSLNIFSGVRGDAISAQGFYTRWTDGFEVYFRNAAGGVNAQAYSHENIFSTKEAAKKELFTRRLRYPNLMKGRAA